MDKRIKIRRYISYLEYKLSTKKYKNKSIELANLSYYRKQLEVARRNLKKYQNKNGENIY